MSGFDWNALSGLELGDLSLERGAGQALSPSQKLLQSRLLKALLTDLAPLSRVLVCGEGPYAPALLRAGHSVTIAGAALPDSALKELEAASFDAVLCPEDVYPRLGPEDRLACLSACARALKKDGRLYAVCRNMDMAALSGALGADSPTSGEVAPASPLSFSQAREEIAQSGLEILREIPLDGAFGLLSSGSWRLSEAQQASLFNLSERLREKPEFLGLCDHFLLVCSKEGPGYIRSLRRFVGHAPLIMAGASVIVENERGEILLQKRADNGCYSYLGGALELNESLEEAAARELFEESGLKALELSLYGVFSGPKRHYIYPNGDQVQVVDHVYLCRRYEGLLRLDEESTELAFYPKSALPHPLSPPTAEILLAYARGLRADQIGK